VGGGLISEIPEFVTLCLIYGMELIIVIQKQYFAEGTEFRPFVQKNYLINHFVTNSHVLIVN
jgi:hypothetical protein